MKDKSFVFDGRKTLVAGIKFAWISFVLLSLCILYVAIDLN